jgi:hypothetical protein
MEGRGITPPPEPSSHSRSGTSSNNTGSINNDSNLNSSNTNTIENACNRNDSNDHLSPFPCRYIHKDIHWTCGCRSFAYVHTNAHIFCYIRIDHQALL